MAFKRVDEVACACVPYLASSVIASSDEFVPIFVEAAIGQG